MKPDPGLSLRDVEGLAVGHHTDSVRLTGCTVVLARDGAVAGVYVRGAAPGTRETDLLRPTALVERVHAVCLAGGSAFGLAAADGVMRYLAERAIGFETGIRPVPIVPAAIIFDLGVGDPDARPGPDDGYAACLAAERGEGPMSGAVGAGTGATVGKLGGMERAMPAGIGSAGTRLPDGSLVAALAVNNAIGMPTPAGSQEPGEPGLPAPGMSTVLLVAATDAELDRSECRRLAELAHDGIALAIAPAHTLLDGDVSFVLSTARRPAPRDLPERVAFDAALVAVVRAALDASVPAR